MTEHARIDWRQVEATLDEFTRRPHPFVRGARGPDAFDCWGLVLEVRRRLGLPVPPDGASGTLDPAGVRALFLERTPPEWVRAELTLGAVILADDPRSGVHAGVHVAGRILHAHPRAGVIAWTLGAWVAIFGSIDAWEVRAGAPPAGA